ncbi:hypothetical protein D3C71_1141960 [compost metagenome]
MQLVAFRGFRLQVRVAEVRVVQVVERRCAKAFAVGQQHVVVWIQRQGEGAAPSVLTAELLVVVVAQAQLCGEAVRLITMLDERRTVPATVFVERGAAVDPVFIPVAAEDQAVAFVECQVVLPVHRVAIGVEHAALIAELVEGLLAVFAVAELDAGFPQIVDPRVDVAADAAYIEFVVGLLLD